jgi:hypothetical protein
VIAVGVAAQLIAAMAPRPPSDFEPRRHTLSPPHEAQSGPKGLEVGSVTGHQAVDGPNPG